MPGPGAEAQAVVLGVQDGDGQASLEQEELGPGADQDGRRSFHRRNLRSLGFVHAGVRRELPARQGYQSGNVSLAGASSATYVCIPSLDQNERATPLCEIAARKRGILDGEGGIRTATLSRVHNVGWVEASARPVSFRVGERAVRPSSL